jgi:hypothetical protein
MAPDSPPKLSSSSFVWQSKTFFFIADFDNTTGMSKELMADASADACEDDEDEDED